MQDNLTDEKYPCYPAYKDSGVDWLGKVPHHWKVVNARQCLSEYDVRNTCGRTEYLSLMAGIGVIPYEEKGDIGNKKPEDLSKCKLVDAGDFVINSMNFQIGSFGRSTLAGVCSGVYVVLRPREHEAFPEYMMRMFQISGFQKHVQSYGNGILEHRMSFGWDDIKWQKVPSPPLSEQKTIAAFLDRETAKIDTLIEKQERLIALLGEKRQAVISQAVTKGLNPNALMKESGVEWLGEMPAHWEVIPIQHLITLNDEVLAESTEKDFEIEYVEISNVTARDGISGTQMLAFEDAPSRARRRVKDGDLIISTVRTYLRAVAAVIDPPENLIVSTGFAVLRPNARWTSDFASYAVQAESFIESVISHSVGVSYPAINASDLSKIKIALPPIKEQQSIASFIRSEEDKIKLLVAKANTSISLMKEHRATLISAAVTGKIDVRN